MLAQSKPGWFSVEGVIYTSFASWGGGWKVNDFVVKGVFRTQFISSKDKMDSSNKILTSDHCIAISILYLNKLQLYYDCIQTAHDPGN